MMLASVCVCVCVFLWTLGCVFYRVSMETPSGPVEPQILGDNDAVDLCRQLSKLPEDTSVRLVRVYLF